MIAPQTKQKIRTVVMFIGEGLALLSARSFSTSSAARRIGRDRARVQHFWSPNSSRHQIFDLGQPAPFRTNGYCNCARYPRGTSSGTPQSLGPLPGGGENVRNSLASSSTISTKCVRAPTNQSIRLAEWRKAWNRQRKGTRRKMRRHKYWNEGNKKALHYIRERATFAPEGRPASGIGIDGCRWRSVRKANTCTTIELTRQ